MKAKTATAEPTREERIEALMADVEKKHGTGSIQRVSSTAPRVPHLVIPSGSLQLDRAMGIGGYPRGRVVEVFGAESCLDASTHVNYAVIHRDGSRANCKGGSIERLYERFHSLPASGDGRGMYQRACTEGAFFSAPSINEHGRVFHNRVLDVVKVGSRECSEITTASGRRIIATPDHRFFDGDRYVRLGNIGVGSSVYIHNNTPYRVADQDLRDDRHYVYVKHHPVARVKIVRPNAGRSAGRGYRYEYHMLR